MPILFFGMLLPVMLFSDQSLSAPQPVVQKIGDRCFNGTYWTYCQVTNGQAEAPEPIEGPTFLTRIVYLDGTSARIDVIETKSTCLYIAVTPDNGPAMVAVSKFGKGCR